MNQNVNPVTAAIIILISLGMISLIFWARGESLRAGGPDQIQLDRAGNIHIHVADKLYKLDRQLNLLNEYDLPELGIHDLVGDFAFFADGGMLVRLGKYEPGLVESIMRYFRVADTKQPVAKHNNEGLYRCQLNIKECVPFGSNNLDFDSAFHLSIDTHADTVYLSDTGRHKLRKYSAQGKELAVQHNGYKFPNQIMLQDNQLLVADTNHHAIQVAETGDDKFGRIIATHSILNDALGGNTWTYSFAKVAGNWWVNNMAGSMSHGAVAMYSGDWRFIKTIALPADADPIDFAVLDNRVLISDLSNIRIYQLDQQGNLIDGDLPDAISLKLTHLQNRRIHYNNLTYSAIGLFILFLLGGFAVAIRQARSTEEGRAVTPSQRIHININDPDIRWVPVNKQKMRLLKFGLLLPLLLIPIIPFMFMTSDEAPVVMPLVAAILLASLAPLLTYKLLAVGLGAKGDLLVIKKSAREFASAKGKNIYYSDTHILIDDVYIPFSRQQLLFDTESVIKEIMPLLRDATFVQGGQMMNMILKRQKPWRIAAMFVFALVIGAMLLSDMYQ
ncbi:MAG: hypothetical protein L0Z73_07465 [Gammaproteobacteria bacterium]|nr:hypothetical protein [Gammaproteobacteria bacterium]